MTSGIIVARDGYSVEEATILQQVFNSDLNTLKIAAKGSFNSTASGTRSVNIAHGLDYAPVYLVFFTVTGSGIWYADNTVEPNSGGICRVTTQADDENLTVTITSTSSKSVDVLYFIMIDPGESV